MKKPSARNSCTRLLRHAPIALEHVRALHLDDADFAGRDRRAGLAGRRCARSTPGSGKPTVPGAPLAVVGVRGDHVGLGHAVALEDRVAGALAPCADASRPAAAPSRRRTGACLRAGLPRQALAGRAGAYRRSARPSSRSRAAAPRRSRPGRTAAGRSSSRRDSSATLEATNRPCVWKIGSAWISTSALGEAPDVDQRQRVRRQIGVRQHRALGAAGRARGVEDRGEIVAARGTVSNASGRGGDRVRKSPVAPRRRGSRPRASPSFPRARAPASRRSGGQRVSAGSASPRKYSSSASV